MSSEKNVTVNSGMGLGAWVFIVFLVLKLGAGDTPVEHWSWWWVTAPLWGSFALFLLIVVIVGIVAVIVTLFKSSRRRTRTPYSPNRYRR